MIIMSGHSIKARPMKHWLHGQLYNDLAGPPVLYHACITLVTINLIAARTAKQMTMYNLILKVFFKKPDEGKWCLWGDAECRVVSGVAKIGCKFVFNGIKDKTKTYKQGIHEKFRGYSFKFFLPRLFEVLVPLPGSCGIVCGLLRFQCLVHVK